MRKQFLVPEYIINKYIKINLLARCRLLLLRLVSGKYFENGKHTQEESVFLSGKLKSARDIEIKECALFEYTHHMC